MDTMFPRRLIDAFSALLLCIVNISLYLFQHADKDACLLSSRCCMKDLGGGGWGGGGVGTYEHKLNLGPLMPEGFLALSHPEIITTTTKGAILHF